MKSNKPGNACAVRFDPKTASGSKQCLNCAPSSPVLTAKKLRKPRASTSPSTRLNNNSSSERYDHPDCRQLQRQRRLAAARWTNDQHAFAALRLNYARAVQIKQSKTSQRRTNRKRRSSRQQRISRPRQLSKRNVDCNRTAVLRDGPARCQARDRNRRRPCSTFRLQQFQTDSDRAGSPAAFRRRRN